MKRYGRSPLTHHRKLSTVLYLGRLEKRKGIQDLFAAIPQVLAKIPNVQFIIAGANNSHRDGFQQQTGLTYAAYFQQQYAQFTGQVSFLGQVSEEKLNELYQTCDLFVAPSLYESFGLIYLEAMNYGKPVIGCRAGGIPEVINEGITGLLAEPEAPDSLAKAMLKHAAKSGPPARDGGGRAAATTEHVHPRTNGPSLRRRLPARHSPK